MEHYSSLLKGFNNMAMAKHKVYKFNDEQIKIISNKCLFLCGNEDCIVNTAGAKHKFDKYGIQYQFYSGVGHGINHEISESINKKIIEYLTV